MDFGGPSFVMAIILVATIGWLGNNWIRARHGYPLEDEWGGKTAHPDDGARAKLLEENRNLTDRLEGAEDRIAVLERIITDRGYQLSHEIEALRDRPASLEAKGLESKGQMQ